MTNEDRDRLTRVEQSMQDMPELIAARIIEKMDERFLTRREAKAANWVFGALISVISLVLGMAQFFNRK